MRATWYLVIPVLLAGLAAGQWEGNCSNHSSWKPQTPENWICYSTAGSTRDVVLVMPLPWDRRMNTPCLSPYTPLQRLLCLPSTSPCPLPFLSPPLLSPPPSSPLPSPLSPLPSPLSPLPSPPLPSPPPPLPPPLPSYPLPSSLSQLLNREVVTFPVTSVLPPLPRTCGSGGWVWSSLCSSSAATLCQ